MYLAGKFRHELHELTRINIFKETIILWPPLIRFHSRKNFTTYRSLYAFTCPENFGSKKV